MEGWTSWIFITNFLFLSSPKMWFGHWVLFVTVSLALFTFSPKAWRTDHWRAAPVSESLCILLQRLLYGDVLSFTYLGWWSLRAQQRLNWCCFLYEHDGPLRPPSSLAPSAGEARPWLAWKQALYQCPAKLDAWNPQVLYSSTGCIPLIWKSRIWNFLSINMPP